MPVNETGDTHTNERDRMMNGPSNTAEETGKAQTVVHIINNESGDIVEQRYGTFEWLKAFKAPNGCSTKRICTFYPNQPGHRRCIVPCLLA